VYREVNPVEVMSGKEGRWKKTVPAHARTMGALQLGEFELKHVDLRLECSDIRAAAQYVLLDAQLFLSNTILFVGLLPCRWKLTYSYETGKDNATRHLRHLVFQGRFAVM
jgi:hypothetical protein